MSKFKVGDIVRRTYDSFQGAEKGGIYQVEIANSFSMKLKGLDYNTFEQDNFELVEYLGQIEPVHLKEPINQITPPPMTINYFHTAVLIKKPIASTTTASSEIEWEELEPYKVRTAKSREDLEKILLRELDKSVDHNNVHFLINPIF